MSGNSIAAIWVPAFVFFWTATPPLYAADAADTNLTVGIDRFGRALPASASQTLATDRRALWESLTAQEQEQHVKRFVELLGPAVQREIERLTAGSARDLQPVLELEDSGVATAGSAERVLNKQVTLSAAPGQTASLQSPGCDPTAACSDTADPLALAGADADDDGLTDKLELRLAEGLIPAYHVSSGEVPTTGFVTLQDTSTLVAQQFLGQVPAAVHYRVTPLFEAPFNGIPHKFLQIDYLTIWNRDDGLEIGGLCRTNAAILGGLIGLGLVSAIDGARAHDWDVERSAVLVAAPTANAGSPGAYRAYDYYLAAHEGTFLNQSAYIPPPFPAPVGNHALLWSSRSKHATYEGNPNFFPLIPAGLIAFTYFLLDDLYFSGLISDIEYLIFLGIADSVYFSCIVEHFGERGAALPNFQLNVGEKKQPINGSSWIVDPRVRPKFQPLWVLR